MPKGRPQDYNVFGNPKSGVKKGTASFQALIKKRAMKKGAAKRGKKGK